MNTAPTSDEKVMAALAHGSIFIAFFGPIIPIGVWAFQRNKSKYVSLHALQAMGYQTLVFWLWIVVVMLIMIFAMCLAFPLAILITENSDNAVLAPFAIQMFIFAFILAFMGLVFLTGVIGAVFCLLGRDFRYPVIGKWLERYLSYAPDSESPMDEAQADHWVAAICHATAILQLWGVATPLMVWFTQRERSVRLQFQAMQAFVYQGIAFIVYVVGMILYMVSFFGMFMIPLAAGVASQGREIRAPIGMIMLVFVGVIAIIWLVVMLLMPIYYLLAAFASVRMIQGRPFRYPILGKLLEKRMKLSQSLEANP